MGTAKSETIFDTVPAQDYLALFEGGRTNYKRVVELLEYRKEDVAAAAGVPKNSVRYDEKIPQELSERMNEWAVALSLVGSHFKDATKTILWLRLPNPLLGNVSPRDMIRMGHFKKLLKFIQTALDENKR